MKSNQQEECELRERVNQMDGRLTKVENAVAEMRSESRAGFDRVTDAVNTLGHDFGERMNVMEKRIVEEKEKWGSVLREIVRWTARALLLVASAAAGVNLAKVFIH